MKKNLKDVPQQSVENGIITRSDIDNNYNVLV